MPVRTKIKMVQNMVKKISVITMAIVYNMRHGFMIRKEECWVKRAA